jgi:hypothetical protein
MATKKKLLSQTISEDFTASPESNLEKENSKPLSKLKSILAAPNPQASPFCKTPLTSKVKGATLGNLLKMTVGLPDSKTATLSSVKQTSSLGEEAIAKPSTALIKTPSRLPPSASQKLFEQPSIVAEASHMLQAAPLSASKDDDQPIIIRKKKKKLIVEDEEDICDPISQELLSQPQVLKPLNCADQQTTNTSESTPLVDAIVQGELVSFISSWYTHN